MDNIFWHETKMTSNTIPAPLVASASSVWSNNVNYLPYKSFNGTYNSDYYDLWVSAQGVANGWIQIQYDEKKKVRFVRIYSNNIFENSDPKNFTIQGSNDGTVFDDLLNVENATKWGKNDFNDFDLGENYSYSYYRITIKSNNGNTNYVTVGEIKFGFVKYSLAIKNPTTQKTYSLAEKTLIQLSNDSDESILLYGIEVDKEVKLDEAFDKIRIVKSDGTYTEEVVEPFSIYNYVSDNPEIILYNDSEDNLSILSTVSPFSVYDYISENPQVIIYTESTDDITISTITEPYDLYDEFGDELEVVYYTDDGNVTEADLILEANWSPVDELEGDFEVVTWTDEDAETAQRALEMTAIPKPQFVKLVNPKRLYGYLDDVISTDISKSYRDEVRYLFSSQDTTRWYAWNKKAKTFEQVDASSHDLILKNGMKHNDLAELTQSDWRTWEEELMNIGVFLKDNPRDTIVSVVDNISYQDFLPRKTTELEKANFYILNTTAKIDLSLVGNTIEGVLSDADLTRVQYRIILNGNDYYPVGGGFTNLSPSPQNISFTINSKDILVDDINTLIIEFKDFFGTVDYWQTTFIGTYSGLMFKDINGDYYSNDIGEVIKYLDFGMIIAGQTTVEHEIILRNQYGYDVRNISLYANKSNFPKGMDLQFGKSLAPFISEDSLLYSDVLKNNSELSFYVRIKTELGATPNSNGSFDIIVRADKV